MRLRADRSEVPALRVTVALAVVARFEKALGKHEIRAQRIEHVLPGANGAWIADARRNATDKGRDQIGQQAVSRPIAAAERVAGARGGDCGTARRAAAEQRAT
jgi:hypothetical protein